MLRLSPSALAVVLLLATPAVAAAAPLSETEPNEDVLTANGPIPADGWTMTKQTSNDSDVGFIRLQGRQQVTFSVQALSGCTTGVRVVTDSGTEVIRTTAGTNPATYTWTTPRDAAQYTVFSYDRSTGCAGLFKVTPASAVIAGPLPTADYGRTLAVTAPASLTEGQSATISVNGVGAYKDRVSVALQSSGCAAGPPRPSSSSDDDPLGSELPGGAFGTSQVATAPGDGQAVACAWLVDGLGKLPTLTQQQNVTVVPPPASISVKAASRTRPGSRFKVTATATGGPGRLAIVDLNKPGVPCGADARTNGRFARAIEERIGGETVGTVGSDSTTPGAYTLCGYVQESDSDPEPAEAVATRTVQVGTTPAQATCRVASASVRRTRLLSIRCNGVPSAGSIKVAIKRRGKPVRVTTTRVRGTRAAVRAPGRRGRYVVTVSYRGRVLATRTVRVR